MTSKRERETGFEEVVGAPAAGSAVDLRVNMHSSLARALKEGAQTGVVNSSLVELIHLLSSLAMSKGRWEEAELLCNLVLSVRKQVLGSLHPDVADSLTRLSALMKLTRRDEEARDLELRARCINAQ